MAENKDKGANLREALDAKERSLKIEQEILALEDKKGKKAEARRKALKEEYAAKEKILNNSKAYLEYNKKITKGSEDFAKSYAKLSKQTRSNLGGEMKNATIIASINSKRVQLEAQQASLTGDALADNQEMVARLLEQETSLISQAKAVAQAEAKARGLSDIAQQLKNVEEDIAEAKKQGNAELVEQLELERDGLLLREQLEKKQERIESIAASTKKVMDSMPEGVQNAVSFGQELVSTMKSAGAGAAAFLLLASVITAAISEFTKIDEAAKEFRETTGLTNTQMKGVKDEATAIRGYFADIGIEAKNVFDTIAALKGEFSDVAEFSQETVGALAVLGANFGISADSAAKVQNQLEAIGGLSSETAASVQMQVADMAKLAGVAPKKVFADIAENAETTSKFFKGDVTLLAKQAIEARRLGTNLKAVAENAEKLLDFESGIEEELTAATFVGGQFNLSRARALAFEGKLVEAQKETLSQIQKSGDFRKKDYFTQQQLAKAAGMSVEEINKQLNAQEKLNSLSTEQRKAAEDAIEKGLDITNINADQLAQETKKFAAQQETQSQLDQLQNSFSSIAATIGTTLTPLIQGLIPILDIAFTPLKWAAKLFQAIVDNGYALIPIIGAIAIAFGGMAIKSAIKAKNDMVSAVASIFAGNAKFGPAGIITAGLAVGSLIALAAKAMNSTKAGDVISPATGKTQISTKEGQLLELSPNDDLIAAPGAASALQNKGGDGATAIIPNLATLAAPLNAMIGEIKALRADLNSGKIAVYMDTAKVTSNVAKSVDQSARNNYNIAST